MNRNHPIDPTPEEIAERSAEIRKSWPQERLGFYTRRKFAEYHLRTTRASISIAEDCGNRGEI